MTGKKYKRLEADMFRSRIELVNALSTMETDRAKYDRDVGEAKQRVADFETALREADEVYSSSSSLSISHATSLQTPR